MTRFLALVVALSALCTGCSTPTAFTMEAQRSLREATDVDELDNFDFGVYPRTGFGVLTVYERRWGPDIGFSPLADVESFFRSDLDPALRQQLIKNMVISGRSGGINFSLKKANNFSLEVASPELYGIVSAEAGINVSREIGVEASANRLEFKELRILLLREAVEKGYVNADIARMAKERNIRWTDGAFILTDYTVTVDTSGVTDATVKAKLAEKFKDFSNTSIGLKLKSESGGKFTFKSDEPVVVAVRLVRPRPWF
ncbi:MAG: hypothetical protein H7144_04880 [Burkholderiales bacterium]|nr:hypothetical protein [Phycisphaerae bacterium]